MKRLASLLLIVVIIATMSGPVLADKKDKGKEFNPNKLITKDEFFSSFSSLLDDYGCSWKPIEGKDKLTREEMVLTLGKFLIEEGVISKSTSDIPFKDIKNLDKLEKEILMGLYDKGVIKGKTKNTFNPKSKVSYGEAKIVLERIGKLLDEKWDKDDKNIIPFKVIDRVELFQGKEGIVVKEGKDKIYVSITKEFGTPGYSMEVNKIKRIDGRYEIDLSILPPDEDIDTIQVIRYITIDIEIDKSYLIKGSYKFYIRESIKDAIDNNMKNVPFKVNKIVESYNGKEGIVVEEEKDKVLVSITKQFPTPNFAMAVERIVGNKGQYEIHIITAPPKKNIQIQVIKYKTIYLEIDKDDIGKPPYKFKLVL
ncbi:MAG: S-layer homology domain-containing protein [Tissierellia bacterium]|nr:S-layer homology domain-containing protein [Tissierellia bacterium]